MGVCVRVFVGVFVLWDCLFGSWEVVGEIFVGNVRRLVYCMLEFLGDFFKELGFRVCECVFEVFLVFMY